MNVSIIAVPYDSGMRGVRMGAGPEDLIAAGLPDRLRALGHDVEVTPVAHRTEPLAEVSTAFELMRAVAGHVAATDRFPLLLAGNCSATIGVLAGLREDAAVAWFDAHGDFNTPETTRSGFLDGMALAVATGRCWRALAETVIGFRPVPEARTILIGARDLDDAEREALRGSEVRLLPAEAARDREAVGAVLDALDGSGGRIHVHVDLDVIDVSFGRANHYACPGGLTPENVIGVIEDLGRRFTIAGLALASWDPAADPGGAIRKIALEIAQQTISIAARQA